MTWVFILIWLGLVFYVWAHDPGPEEQEMDRRRAYLAGARLDAYNQRMRSLGHPGPY